MGFKRRNGGKNRYNRGSVTYSRCSNCGRVVPKDKAIKRFLVRNMVETAGIRDLRDSSAYKVYAIPKLYIKVCYCVSCAIHARIVRARNKVTRKVRVKNVPVGGDNKREKDNKVNVE